MKKVNGFKKLVALVMAFGMAILPSMSPTLSEAFVTQVHAEPTENENDDWEEVQDIVSRYYGEWKDNSYRGQLSNSVPQTALMGNGDLGVSSGGSDTEKTFRISKSDYWTASGGNGGRPIAIGGVTVKEASEDEPGIVAKNIAPNYKNVRASTTHENFQPSRAVTGTMVVGDGKEGWVSQVGNPQWFELEFEEAITIGRWVVQGDGAGRGAGERANNPRAFELQISEDGETWTTVDATDNNSADTFNKTLDESVTTKWVRLYLTETTQGGANPRARIAQFELYEPTPAPSNFAPTYKSVSASSNHDAFPPNRAVTGTMVVGDGNEGWVSQVGKPQWLKLEFEEEVTIGRWVVQGDGAGRGAGERANNPRAFELQVSDDGEAWTSVDVTTNNSADTFDKNLDELITTKWVRLYLTEPVQSASEANPRARVAQFELYAMPKQEEEESEPEEPAHFYEKQDILNAKVDTEVTLAKTPLEMETFTAATENLVITKITSVGDAPTKLSVEPWASNANTGTYPVAAEASADTVTVTRTTAMPSSSYNNEGVRNGWRSEAAVSTKIIGADEVSADVLTDAVGRGALVFTLDPGETVYAVTAVGGGGQTYTGYPDYTTLNGTKPSVEAQAILAEISNEEDITNLRAAHSQWWKDYWTTSYVDFGTSDRDLNDIQKYYYGAQYMFGCATGDGDNIAPGLFGHWHTNDSPSWNGDFHLNYNFIATWYGAYSSNRTQQTLTAVDAIKSYMGTGSLKAENTNELRRIDTAYVNERVAKGDFDPVNGIEGALLYPVGIGPWGITPDNAFHKEAVNAPLSAFVMTEYYKYTQDEEFLASCYDYLKGVATFGATWMEKDEEGNYTLFAGYNEGSWSKNPAVELAAYKLVFQNAIMASEKLNVDADLRAKWQEILDGMAPQPIVNYRGNDVYALAELEWRNNQWQVMSSPIPGDGNCIPLEGVFPGGQMGYYSPAEEIQVVHNTIDAFGNGVWSQINSFAKAFPVSTAMRYDIRKIISSLATVSRNQLANNLWINDNNHGVEKCGTTGAINNMMLIGDQGVVKVFPNWLENRDAKFKNLLAPGAFEVSSEYDGKARQAKYVEITSEVGGELTLASPWKKGITVKDADGVDIPTSKGTAPNHDDEVTYTFATTAGMTYTITEGNESVAGNSHNPYEVMKASDADVLYGDLVKGIGTLEDTSASDYAIFEGVEFGTDGALKVIIEAASNGENAGSVELRLGSQDGALIASIPIMQTESNSSYQKLFAELNPAIIDVQDLCLVFTGNASLKSIQFFKDFEVANVTGFTVEGDTAVYLPDENGKVVNYMSVVEYSDNTFRTDSENVKWSLQGPCAGVKVDKSTGVLTIASNVPNQKFDVVATFAGEPVRTATQNVSIYRGELETIVLSYQNDRDAEGAGSNTSGAMQYNGNLVEFTARNGWVRFDNVDLKDGLQKVEQSYASPNTVANRYLAIGVGGSDASSSTTVATMPAASLTGGWQTLEALNAAVTDETAKGVQTIYSKWTAADFNIGDKIYLTVLNANKAELPETQEVTFVLAPSDMKLNICDKDGFAYGLVDGKVALPAGEYTYIASKEGYVTKEDTFEVAAEAQTITIALEEDTTAEEGWVKDATGWKYQLEDGTFLTNEWKKTDGLWYYLGENGYLKTGWVQDGGKWYFLDRGTGAMKMGWIKDGKWYYLGADGAMRTGWLKDGDDYYFLDRTNGNMKTGWVEDSAGWYFMHYDTGIMATDAWIGNYWVDSDGKWDSSKTR